MAIFSFCFSFIQGNSGYSSAVSTCESLGATLAQAADTGIALSAAAAAAAANFLRIDALHDSTCFTDLSGSEVDLSDVNAPAGIEFVVNQEVTFEIQFL